jgi:two-component system NarL family sensor kinase
LLLLPEAARPQSYITPKDESMQLDGALQQDVTNDYSIAAFALIVIEGALIGALLVERRRHRRTELARHQASKQAQGELEWLTARLLDFQEGERRRLARELHDGTAQNLFALSINLSRLERGPVKPSEVQGVLVECTKLCDEALQEIRTLSYLLHPPMLDQKGLTGAVKSYVDGFTKRSGITVDLRSMSDVGRLPLDVEMALFRIVQESLTNVRRHSGGALAEIRLYKTDDTVVLQIRDFGRGMAKGGPANAVETGVGIPGMQQRVRQLGGVLKIESNDSGTAVTAKVPIERGIDPA